jgi:oligoribonuclease NrnB/cAMP/cGMP phosphodiesterase (DHH superfamily)
MKIFFHIDADGKTAGHIIHDAMLRGRIGSSGTVEFIPINYADPFPMESICPDETVYILDYSITPDEMKALLAKTKDVCWIDHHETAINDYKGFPAQIQGLREVGRAGCVLTYMYVWGCIYEEVPEYVRLIGDRDVWKFEYGDRTRDFCAGIQLMDISPTSKDWTRITMVVNYWCEVGRSVNQYKNSVNAQFLRSWSFETVFEGYKCLAVNGRPDPESFEKMKTKYDICIAFISNGAVWTVSLYSNNIDVGEIAKKHGGGGHDGAAGFSATDLPFRKT